MIIQNDISLEEKLQILSDAAKYDVACTSSGVERKGKPGQIGNTASCGICHSFSSDGRCISLLKILYTNECVFDCKYCINRASNDVPRASFTPEEVCRLTMEFYRRNYIEGLFLSSGILESPNYTMEQICRALRMLRYEYHFNGYIHCKVIPGADASLVEQAGWYADRVSINLELPTAEGLKALAPHKTRKTILHPMRQIQAGIYESRELLGMKGGNQSAYWHTQKKIGNRALPGAEIQNRIQENRLDLISSGQGNVPALMHTSGKLTERGFAPAGQSTQMIIGAGGETDYEIMAVSEALYQKFDLKRVFYSAFINVNADESLPAPTEGVPLMREHRLYQADWLLRYYGFMAKELLSEKQPNFNIFLDPKCNWAVNHLEQFPVEVNRADYYTLLRVPGIGPKSASRIVKGRKTGKVTFPDLKKMGVVLKRAMYFITCSGRTLYPVKMEEDFILKQLIGDGRMEARKLLAPEPITWRQMNLLDDFLVK